MVVPLIVFEQQIQFLRAYFIIIIVFFSENKFH